MKPSLTKLFPIFGSKPRRPFNLVSPLLYSNGSTNYLNFRLFTSQKSVPTTYPSHESNSRKDGPTEDALDVTNKELKEQIDRFFKGDNEAIPSIFEAILRRKLEGTGDESDNEFLDELQRQPKSDGFSEKEFDSD